MTAASVLKNAWRVSAFDYSDLNTPENIVVLKGEAKDINAELKLQDEWLADPDKSAGTSADVVVIDIKTPTHPDVVRSGDQIAKFASKAVARGDTILYSGFNTQKSWRDAFFANLTINTLNQVAVTAGVGSVLDRVKAAITALAGSGDVAGPTSNSGSLLVTGKNSVTTMFRADGHMIGVSSNPLIDMTENTLGVYKGSTAPESYNIGNSITNEAGEIVGVCVQTDGVGNTSYYANAGEDKFVDWINSIRPDTAPKSGYDLGYVYDTPRDKPSAPKATDTGTTTGDPSQDKLGAAAAKLKARDGGGGR